MQQTTVKLSYQLNIEWSMVEQHLLRGEAYFSQGRKNKIYACVGECINNRSADV